jgi:Mg-chelatase subunit ChlI
VVLPLKVEFELALELDWVTRDDEEYKEEAPPLPLPLWVLEDEARRVALPRIPPRDKVRRFREERLREPPPRDPKEKEEEEDDEEDEEEEDEEEWESGFSTSL